MKFFLEIIGFFNNDGIVVCEGDIGHNTSTKFFVVGTETFVGVSSNIKFDVYLLSGLIP